MRLLTIRVEWHRIGHASCASYGDRLKREEKRLPARPARAKLTLWIARQPTSRADCTDTRCSTCNPVFLLFGLHFARVPSEKAPRRCRRRRRGPATGRQVPIIIPRDLLRVFKRTKRHKTVQGLRAPDLARGDTFYPVRRDGMKFNAALVFESIPMAKFCFMGLV